MVPVFSPPLLSVSQRSSHCCCIHSQLLVHRWLLCLTPLPHFPAHSSPLSLNSPLLPLSATAASPLTASSRRWRQRRARRQRCGLRVGRQNAHELVCVGGVRACLVCQRLQAMQRSPASATARPLLQLALPPELSSTIPQIVHYDPKAVKLAKGEGFPFR